MNESSRLGVVFDVNVYVDAFSLASLELPFLERVPPTSKNSALDAVSLAFDGELFRLFISPHIIRNIAKVLSLQGQSDAAIAKVLETIVEIVEFSGGAVVEPPRMVNDCADFEDNLVLDLTKAVGATILVTWDRELLGMNPWRHRLIMNPRDFVGRVL